jgi:hypothetical protein
MGIEQLTDVLGMRRQRGLHVLAGDVSVQELRERLLEGTGSAALIGEIKAEAARMLGDKDPDLTYSLFRLYRDTGERLTYERSYFERRKRLAAFSLLVVLEPDNELYVEALHNTIWSICNEFTWCLPAHYDENQTQTAIDLFAAETGFALSEALLLAENRLPSLLIARIRAEVERRLFHPFLTEGPYGWEQAEHNWSAVCAGSIGAAALHLVDDSERLAAILGRVLPAMDCFLAGYGDDGVCAEGYLYWQYGFGYFVYFAQLLKASSSGELDLFQADKVKAIALFQQKCFTDGNTVVNFSDSLPESGIFLGLSACLRQEYPEVIMPPERLRAPYAADHCGRWAPALRNLIWHAEASEADGESVWPAESYYLPDAKWLLSRKHDRKGGSFSFAAKGGHNDEPHNHNDVGHFLLHADGEAFLADLGSGMYTANYFGAERYSYWCNGSQGHSVPIVNGQHQLAGKQYAAVVLEALTGEHEDRITLELGGAYGEDLQLGLERRLHWNKAELSVLTLTDAFSWSGRGEGAGEGEGEGAGRAIVERFITMLEPKAAGPGKLVLQGKQRQLAIGYDETVWKVVVTARTDMDHFGRERGWFTLDFEAAGDIADGLTGEFVFQFSGGDAGVESGG